MKSKRLALVGLTILSTVFNAYASETDDRIVSTIKESYVFKTYLKNDNISIEAKDGNVTLSGDVSAESHKALAKETVASTPSVLNINDQLLVKGENHAEKSDGWITTKVKTNLMFHRHVSGIETEVNTVNGIVTLKGVADNAAEKDLTGEYAKDVEGVKAGQPLILLDALFVAPFSGTVTSLPFKVSETVFPQMKVLQLTDLRNRYLLVSLEQQGAVRIKQGQVAKISFESFRNRMLTGVVKRIYPSDGQFYVRIDTTSLPKEVLPGMTADVAIEIAKHDQALLVPTEAVISGKVALVRNGKKKKVDVVIGMVDGDMAELISGDVQESDQISVKK